MVRKVPMAANLFSVSFCNRVPGGRKHGNSF